MTQERKYIWLRNVALISICGWLCYSLFPVPPFTWKLMFLGVAFLSIGQNLNNLTSLEKSIIVFLLFHLVYFFASYFWLDNPSTTLIGNISVSLSAIPLFMTLGRKGVMNSRFYSVATIMLLLSALVYYKTMEIEYIANLIGGNEDITNNASVAFLCILPLIFVLKNRYLSYGVLLVCVYFILDAAKRGNIISAVPVLLLFIFSTFRTKAISIYEKAIFLAFCLVAASWGIKQYEENEYLQKRIEQTMDGYSSGRDKIYENAWNVYSESENVKNLIFGYGFQATFYNEQIGNYAHNDWLELLVDNGIIGALFYLSIFILLIKMIRSEKDLQKRFLLMSIVSIWFLKSLFSMTYTGETTFILFLMFGFISQRKDISLQNHLTTQKVENK